MLKTLMCAGGLLVASPVAQSLLRDLNQDQVNPGSSPAAFTRSGNLVYFRQSSNGVDLWATDGTSAGTNSLGLPTLAQNGEWTPPEIADLDGAGTVVLAVNDASAGNEPWVARANPHRLERLADIVPGTAGSNPHAFLRVGNVVLFGLMNRNELWRTDGTQAGTRLVATLPRPITRKLVALPGRALFASSNEIWSSDGTAAGTQRLAISLQSTVFAAYGQRMAFLGYDLTHGSEPWLTDGTPAGTGLVADVTPGLNGSTISCMVQMGSSLVFGMIDGLWTSDGTANGTRRALAATTWQSQPGEMTVLGDRCYFITVDASSGSEPWLADFSLGSMARLADLNPGVGGSFAAFLGAVGNDMLLVARPRPGDTRLQLHRVGADRVVEALPWHVERNTAAVLGSRMLVSAAPLSSDAGFEPATVSGRNVSIVRELVAAFPASSLPDRISADAGVAYFLANGGAAVGRELWVTDGTASGTRLFADVTTGPASSGIRNLFCQDRKVWFDLRASIGTDYQLHVGDAHGVRPLGLAGVVEGVASAPRGRGVVLAIAPANSSVPCLAISDGTAAGTRPLHAALGWAAHLTRAGETVFFVGTAASGTELWATDGTPAGTRLVVDLTPNGSSAISDLIPFGNRVAFAVSTGSAAGLYVSDGTAAGTVKLAAGSVTQVAVVDRLVYCMLDSDLWVSDGTVGQTRSTGVVQPSVRELITAGATLYLAVGGSRNQLLATEGSAASLRLVHQSAAAVTLSRFVPTASGSLVFSEVGAHRKLLVTDGSVLGTRVVHDNLAATPVGLGEVVKVDRGVIFAAESPPHGAELWRMSFAELGIGDADVAGSGCHGALGTPRLHTPIAPRLGSVAFALRIDGAAPNAGAALWLSAQRARIELPGGCTLHATPDIAVQRGTDAAGATGLNLSIPPSNALLGAGCYVQGLVVDPQGAALGLLALSNGLELTIGR